MAYRGRIYLANKVSHLRKIYTAVSVKCQGLAMQWKWRQWMNNVNLYKPLHVRTLELGNVEQCESEITVCTLVQRTVCLELVQEFKLCLIA